MPTRQRRSRRRTSPSLVSIDARAMRKAIAKFNYLGRLQFLKRYGFRRSSRYFLHFDQRIYDTKALVAAAYEHAKGASLRYNQFSGGSQTLSVFHRLVRDGSSFGEIFEDSLGELRNLFTEYDRIPRAWSNLHELGFSKWIPLQSFSNLKTGWLPGV